MTALVPALLAASVAWLAVPVPLAWSWARRVPQEGARAARPPDPGWVAGALVLLLSWVLLGWPVGVVAGLALAPVARHVVRSLEPRAVRRRRERLAEQLPVAVDLVVCALRAGRPVPDALDAVGAATAAPLGPCLQAVAARWFLAGEPSGVWNDADAVLVPLGRAVVRADLAGAPVADLLARLADDLRRERRGDVRRRVQSVAVASAAPLGVCFLPAFFLVGIVPSLVGLLGSVLP